MSRQSNFRGPIPTNGSSNGRPQSKAEEEKGMWSSMLDSVASGKKLPEKNIVVLGGSPETQKEFLETLASDAPKRPQDRHRRKPVVANEFALGYTYQDVLDADHEDILARLSIYLLSEPEPSFAPLLNPLFTPQSIPETLLVMLLDWNEPWLWVRQLRDWITLLRDIRSSLDNASNEIMDEVMKEWQQRKRGVSTYDTGGSGAGSEGNVTLPLSQGEWDEPLGLPLCVVCHNADKIDSLELEQSWKEEEFDFVLQFLRTILMKHGASLIYTSNSVPNSLPTLLHSTLGIHSLLRKQALKHNVIDRDKVLVPPNWDSWGKIRVLREGFDVEGTSSGWSKDIQGRSSTNSTDQTPSPEGAVLPIYESTISNPRKSRSTNPLDTETTIEIPTRPTQDFLASQLETIIRLQAEDDRAAATSKSPGTNKQHDERVNEHIGPVQVNMGGIQVDADDIVRKLKNREKEAVTRTPEADSPSVAVAKSPEDAKAQNEALNSFFAGLMKRGTSGSPRGTPGREGKSASGKDTPSKKPPLLEQTIGDHFASIVSKFGDRPAVISRHQGARLTYGALDKKSRAFAQGLLALGVKKGDRVAVMLGNNIEYAIATYGLFKLGAILVPLNPGFNAHQVIAALSHLEASYLIIGAETNLPRKEPRSNLPLLQQLIPNLQAAKLESEVVPSLREVILVQNSEGRIDSSTLLPLYNFETIIFDGRDSYSPFPRETSLHPDEIINIQFTSGTTSLPKAACLSHRSILNNGKSIGDRMLLTENDVVCCPPPLFHCFGCILGYMATATHGSAIVFPTEAFDPKATLKSVQEEKCTALYGVPTMFVAELELLQNGTISHTGFEHLRTGIAAGSSIPAELMRKLHKILNLTELTICYGMTETSPVSAMTTTNDPLEKRIDSVGRLLAHVKAKVVNPADRTSIVPVGQRGELAVSGYLVMKEYWGDPERTAEVMIPDDNGEIWMHTGDEAEMDAEGYVKITGRIKDIIIRGGENIHPLEVENCLFAHPAVQEVSVVGLPDERYGEVVAAFIIPHQGANVTAEEARAWVREKLSNHLVPKYVFWVENYPKTASGKIQKFKLKEDGLKLVREGHGLQ